MQMGMVSPIPITKALRKQKQAVLCEFIVDLVYIKNTRPAKGYINPASKINKSVDIGETCKFYKLAVC